MSLIIHFAKIRFYFELVMFFSWLRFWVTALRDDGCFWAMAEQKVFGGFCCLFVENVMFL